MIFPPPAWLDYNGQESFGEIGQAFKQHFIDYGMKPDDFVLDVGCGFGRMAIPLTNYLTFRGEYRGFDIVPSGPAWCRENITPAFPNFQFIHADVLNRHYNPTGKTAARDYRFPHDNGYFDFVFLTSVFTHMTPPDVENYLKEIARVMRPGARCLITWFVMNYESRNLTEAGKARFNFNYALDGYLTIDAAHAEAAISYQEAVVWKLYADNGLSIVGPIHYGNWCGRKEFLSFQDVIVAEKG